MPITFLLLSLTLVVSAPACVEKLRGLHAPGARVHDQLREKKAFTFFLNGCKTPAMDLPTAVHEGVHMLTHERNAYPLLDGTFLPRPPGAVRLPAPGRILASQFDRRDMFVRTYLMPGGASSAQDFTYLLDELNAYTHDLAAAVAVRSLHKPDHPQVHHRDRLLALRSFVRRYVATVTIADAATAAAAQRLLAEADRVVATSCSISNFGKAC